MIAKIKRYLLTLAAVLTMAAPAMVPVAAYAADDPANVTNGLNCGANLQLNTNPGDCPAAASGNADFTPLIRRIINVFSVIIGVVAVIMIILAGLKYITSGGESSNVSGAKNTIIYAIVGLVVVALAQFIVRFVLSNASQGLSGVSS